ncbi:MAG: RNA polymerase ECF-type sigma factor [uncultured Thermomicrobiales bacterium]|uniref:RNA polymerase ECF-type sigma factor n=1 Tax=uncultured Thermomicrobiales bacterium TaxID=1645740 RepID=A0A6J4URN7_9BACT|nr:MAG: RNA polymerase ECF-type sigma factor [uncultured Thermomicrobiales bacterium]
MRSRPFDSTVGTLTVTVTERANARSLPSLDDPALVALVSNGNAAALEVLYDRYSRIVFSFAMRILQDRAAAEELLQEVFFRTWKQAHHFSAPRGSFVTWLLSITHNMAIDEIRRQKRRPQRADAADPVLMLSNVVDEQASVEDQAIDGETRDRIVSAIGTLPLAQQTVIELAYFRGLSQREIAEELDQPLGTVKTRLRLGVRKLRESLMTDEVPVS